MTAHRPRKEKQPLQSRLPLLWLAVQYLIAGYFHRGRYILKHFRNHQRVLEIGCSVGIDSGHFADKPCRYLGIDVEDAATASAAKKYARHGHMRFATTDLRDLDPDKERFDFILLCGTTHHIPPDELPPILEQASRLLLPGGSLVVIDYATPDRPGLLERAILKMEEGAHVQHRDELPRLLSQVPGLSVQSQEVFANAAFLGSWPVMAHKWCIHLVKEGDASKGPQALDYPSETEVGR